MDLNILLGLEPKQLRELALESREISEICRRKHFWIAKLNRDFPGTKFDISQARDEYIRLWSTGKARLKNGPQLSV